MTDDEIRAIIRDQFLGGDTSVDLPTDLDLVSAGVCDSFALLQIGMEVEKATGLTIPDSDITADNFARIDSIQAYLASRA